MLLIKISTLLKGACLFLFYISFIMVLQAQTNNRYTIAGAISDNTGNPLAGVSISLKKLNDNSNRTGFSDEAGKYKFEDLSTGKYILTATYAGTIGYVSDTLHMDKNLTNNTFRLNISLNEKIVSLQEVVIQAQKERLEIDKDKIVMNIQNSALTSGKSAFDLMKQLPGVSVGQEDQILLRGSTGINVMIDGKMNYLTGKQLSTLLKGMSTENINKIELSTAPAAEFDAAGNAGIINIVTKRNTKPGYAVDFRSGVSKGRYWMVNENITASLNTRKWNLYGSLDYNTPHQVQTSKSGNSIVEAGENLELQRTNESTYKIKFYTYRLGADWQLLPKHQLSAFYHGYFDDFKSTNYSRQNRYTINEENLYSFSRSLNALTEPYHYDAANLSYKYDIDSLGKKITADAHYISYRNFSDGLLTSEQFDVNSKPTGVTNALRSHQPGFVNIISTKTDMELPYKSFTLKAGLKYAVVTNDNTFRFDSLQAGNYTEVESMSNHFKYTEHIGAAYISFGKKINRTNIDAGLRTEYTQADGYTIKHDIKNKWSYTKLFPTLSVDHEINADNKVNFSISRRINRPTYTTLNPVRWYVDPYFYYSGNPELVPEMAWLFSSAYTFKYKYVLTGSYNHRNNYLTRQLIMDDQGVLKSQSANFRNMQRFDILLSAPVTISSFWDIQFTTGVNYTTYPIFQTDGFNAASKWAANMQVQQQLELPAGFQLEVSSFYYSNELWGVYMRDNAFYSDAGIKKSFMNDDLTIQFSFSDFLKTNRFKGQSLTDVTNYHYLDRPDSHRFGLSVRYHIGGKLINKKGNRIEEQDRL